MPTVVPLYKRKQRRSAAAGVTPASTSYSTATCSPLPPDFHGAGRPNDPNSGACSPLSKIGSSSSARGKPQHHDHCFLCRKDIRYYQETLTCGHVYHSDCYWRWIRVRSNLPEEKSICPRCGFLPSPPPSLTSPFADMAGLRGSRDRRQRKYSSSSDSSLSSSGSSSSSSSDSDVFFL